MFLSLGARKSYFIFLTVLLGFLSIVIGKALSLGNSWINLALLGGLVTAYIGGVFFSHRKIILALYLLTVVNLDYIRLLHEPFNVTVDILFSFTLILLAIPLLLAGKFRWHQSAIQKAFLFFLALTFICVLLSVEPLISLKRWLRYASYFLLFTLLVDAVREKAALRKFTNILIYSAFVPCLIGFYALASREPSLSGENLRFIYGIEMVRIKSTLSHANTFGLFLSIIIPLNVGLLLQRTGPRGSSRKPVLIGLLLTSLPMLYFTYSRIGWIVTMMAILMLLVFQKRWRLLTIFPWLIGLFLWRVPGLITRWSDIADPTQPDSLDWRRNLYSYSLTKFIQKPIFGSGPGTFLKYVAYGRGYSQHHLWIGNLVEVGVVGTLALLILLVVVWVQLTKYARRRPTTLNFTALAVFSALILVSLASDPFDVPSAVIYLWALISLAEAESQLPPVEPPR
jgi:O-antigen ligase